MGIEAAADLGRDIVVNAAVCQFRERSNSQFKAHDRLLGG
jgi:hypothetical protein